MLPINHKKRAFTLIELVMVIVLLGIVSSVGSSFFIPIFRLYFFTPTELRNEFVANRIVENVIEGTVSGRGLRIITSISSANDTAISYTDADGKAISISWNSGTKKISRTINSVTEQTSSSDIKIDGISTGVIFRYYDSSNLLISTPVATPANIKRIQMDWIAYTGSGAVGSNDGRYLIHSGIFIKQF